MVRGRVVSVRPRVLEIIKLSEMMGWGRIGARARPQKELDGLVTREDGKDKVILPIWHNVSKSEVRNFSLILSNKLAVSSNKGVKYVANKVLEVINYDY